MTATLFYDNSAEQAILSASFTYAGSASDPTAVSCVVTDPSGTATVHTYMGASPADIARNNPGAYQLVVPCSPAVTGIDGLWSYAWIGAGAAGTVNDVQPGTWRVLPASVGTWYIGLDEFKDRLNITDTADDSQAQIAIQSVAGWINEFCGRHFNRISETRTFQPDNIWILDVDDLVTVSAVNVDQDGDGVFEQSWVQGTDYQLRLGKGLYNVNATGIARPYRQLQVIQSGKWWPFTWPYTHLDRVQVTAVWGWPAVPPAVTQAAFILASDIFRLKDSPFGVAGVSDIGVVRIQSNPWLVEMLKSYINPKRRVGV